MKILHINTNQEGGAALCAIRINKALVQLGVDSQMLFAKGVSLPNDVKGAIAERDKDFWYSNPLLGKVKHLINRMPWYWDKEKADIILNKKLSNLTPKPYTHHPFSNFKNIANHPLVDWADIIHLHWVSEFVDYPSFFRSVKKPIVWTLHDKNPAVGLLHYYSDFFQIPQPLEYIDTVCQKIKRKSILKTHNLNVVAISEQMASICQISYVLKGLPISLIHNGVDTKIFRPYNKQKAREELKLPIESKIFLFSAYNIHDKNKGLDRVIEALLHIELKNMILVCIGAANQPAPKSSFPIKLTGLLLDQQLLSKYYSAADYFIIGSFEEAFAQTPLEAMACGIPVISTPCSGAKDLIRPFNGVICNGYDSEAIQYGINQALTTLYDATTIRQHIIDSYQYDKIAKQYSSLYTSVLR